jgi:hypothetical protein
MERLSDSHHFRKMVAGVCMIAAPLLFLVAVIVHPEMKTDEAAQLAVVRENLDAWYIAHLIALAAVVLFVPVVLGLMHMLREREVAYGHVGGALGLLGLIAFAGTVAIEFVVWQMAQAGADEVQMAALLERVNETAGVFIPFFLLVFAVSLGLLVLAAGLYRARAVQSWMAVLIAIGAVLAAIGFPTASEALLIVAGAFLLVGLGSTGRMVLTESDADWEHTPEYKGFRPLAGMR